MLDDPFADAIENNVEAPVVKEPEEKETLVGLNGNGGISVTFKFKGAYSDPWVVIHAKDVREALETTRDDDFKSLMDRTRVIANKYGPEATPAPSAPQNRSQSRPQQGGGNRGGGGGRKPAGPPPGVEPQFCDHGQMNYVTGSSNKGPWAAWGCASREGCWEFIND